jgi:hypothetical protein
VRCQSAGYPTARGLTRRHAIPRLHRNLFDTSRFIKCQVDLAQVDIAVKRERLRSFAGLMLLPVKIATRRNRTQQYERNHDAQAGCDLR